MANENPLQLHVLIGKSSVYMVGSPLPCLIAGRRVCRFWCARLRKAFAWASQLLSHLILLHLGQSLWLQMSHFRAPPFEHRTASTIAPFRWTSTFHRSLDEVFIFSAPAQQSEVAQNAELPAVCLWFRIILAAVCVINVVWVLGFQDGTT